MRPPKGLDVSFSNSVCHLQCSLYCLKQASRAWFAKFKGTILEAGFSQRKFDLSMFLHKSAHGFTIFLVYVDDIPITRNDNSSIQHIQWILK